jgi:hypothetical protein
VVIQQTLPTELINVGGALHLAILRLFPLLPGLWANRYAYAVCRWKIDAYTSLRSGSSGQLRTAYGNKITLWTAERDRLAAIMGSDA